MISVLYVDDEPSLLEIGKLFLEKTGQFSVETCTSPLKAREILASTRYDAIVSDYQMPEMDGIAFLKYIRSQGQNLPFILFTGKGREEVVIEALNNGADFYLQKGGEPKSQFVELEHKIKLAIERREALEALQESQARINSMLHGSPTLQYVIDSNHKVISWNRALEEYSGVKPEEVVGTDQQWKAFYSEQRPCLADLLVDEAIEKLPEWYKGKIRKSRFVEGAYEAVDFFPHPGKGGTWLYFTAAPVRNAKGTIIGAVETLVDITDRKLAKDALKLANKKLSLLHNITHRDIRNQLVELQRFLELSKMKIQDQDILNFIEEGEKTANIILRQLEFAKNYENIGSHESKWQRLDRVILRLQLPQHIALEADIAGIEIYADQMLQNVFDNLIDNTVRHGQRVERVRAFSRESWGELIIVWEDDGIGIPDNEKEKIFELNYSKNTGQGLFLNREILSITGIAITETGMFGKGARFEIVVPKGAYRSEEHP